MNERKTLKEIVDFLENELDLSVSSDEAFTLDEMITYISAAYGQYSDTCESCMIDDNDRRYSGLTTED